MKSKTDLPQKYPDARLKAIDDFWDLLKNETDWKPSRVEVNTFKTLGIARKKERNIVFALVFLDVLDKDGAPTVEFQNLRVDIQNTLSRLMRKSYAKVFETIPANRMNQSTLVNFFAVQGYSEDTAEYQAKLFVKLCKDANINLPNVESSFQRARFNKKRNAP